ncbi:hypothetical protein [Rothia terrae]|uniref:hypothetical protein n=1 Tax=Rothia terrae TaxID=396015 RepID=UPI002882BB0F|nr:hypothetical protein [Rothia terrae]MDT0189395.1 hypothetical protein [Rothia terrae]
MEYLIALIPSVFAGIILYLILRWISSADRAERKAQKDAQDDAAAWYESVKNSKGTRRPFEERKSK